MTRDEINHIVETHNDLERQACGITPTNRTKESLDQEMDSLMDKMDEWDEELLVILFRVGEKGSSLAYLVPQDNIGVFLMRAYLFEGEIS